MGSQRIITDATGQIIARKDYSAFGEETVSAQRTTALGYKPENIRQDYTGYEKDDESGLDYAQARYYNSSHGRFTSVDPLTASANVKDPQTFNRYSYALKSPYKFSDPLGLVASEPYGACGTWCPGKGDWVDGSAFHGTDASLDWTQQEQEQQDDSSSSLMILHESLHALDNRPYIADMVGNNEGVDRSVNTLPNDSFWYKAKGRFRFGDGHDGEHVLGSRAGSTVSAIEGLSGTVLGRYAQDSILNIVFILLNDGRTVMVLKDLEHLSKNVLKAPYITGTGIGIFDRKGKVISKIFLKAGDVIGKTREWTGDKNVNKVGLHFGFVKLEQIVAYRKWISTNNGSLNSAAGSHPEYFIGTPCGPSSSVRC